MTGEQVQKYEHMMAKADAVGLNVDVNGDGFMIFKGEQYFGSDTTVDGVFAFLCGYDSGYDMGKVAGIQMCGASDDTNEDHY